MLGRQILIGVSGGGLLAAFVLFLTTPREQVIEALPFLSHDGEVPGVSALPEPDLSQAPVPDDEANGLEPERGTAVTRPEQVPGIAPDLGRVDVVEEAPSEQGAQPLRLASMGMSVDLVGDLDDAAETGKAGHPAEDGLMYAAARGAARGVLVDEDGAEGVDSALDAEPTGPETPLDADPDQLHPEAFLGALSKQTVIRAEPRHDARILGFARTGSVLRRASAPKSHRGCSGGWYRVEPRGYVCVGKAATLDTSHPILRLASYQPDRSLPMPYLYGRSRYPTPPLYTRIPTKEQQQFAEADLASHSRKGFDSAWSEEASTPPPSLLAEGGRIPRPYGYPVLEHDFMTGRALGNSAFAFIDLFRTDDRSYGLTADLSLIPLDRVTPVEASEFAGLVLSEEFNLPVAFIRSDKAHVYRGQPEAGTLRPERRVGYREAFHLTGQKFHLYGATFLETTEGDYLKDGDRVVVVDPPNKLPQWARGDRSWIEVSILNQTLVAYRGPTPVFVTLVSTGKDGLGDPEETHSTPQGMFLVHTKHVTATMSGDAADDEFDLRDVPYVQYFHEGFALHAAFWHDGFGAPRSHGCVNLSPADARYLFTWTDPPVPMRWHSALSREGTLLWIHP